MELHELAACRVIRDQRPPKRKGYAADAGIGYCLCQNIARGIRGQQAGTPEQ